MSFRLREMEEQRKKKLLIRSFAAENMIRQKEAVDLDLYSTLTEEQKLNRTLGTIELFKKQRVTQGSKASTSQTTPVNLTSRKKKIAAAHRENFDQKEYEAVRKTYDLTRPRRAPSGDREVEAKSREKMRLFLREKYFVKIDRHSLALRSQKRQIDQLLRDYHSTDLGETDLTAHNCEPTSNRLETHQPRCTTSSKLSRSHRINPSFMRTFHSTPTPQPRGPAFLVTQFERSVDSREKSVSLQSKRRLLIAVERSAVGSRKNPRSRLETTLYSADDTNATTHLQTTERTFTSFKPKQNRSSDTSRYLDNPLKRKTLRSKNHQATTD